MDSPRDSSDERESMDSERDSGDDERDYAIVDTDTVPAPKLPDSATLEERIAVLRKWLQATDYFSPGNEYMKHVRAHVKGTGAWLLESPTFRSWKCLGSEQGTAASEGKHLLWLKGMAGSGKSVCAASVAAHLHQAHPDTPVVFFFFRQIVRRNHSPEYLVRDFAAQILSHSPLLVSLLGPVSERQGIRGLELTVLWDILRQAMRSLDRVFCVVDALDEMSEGFFPDFIHKLINLADSRIRILVTSRPINRIEDTFWRHPNVSHVKLQTGLISSDIRTYVGSRLARLAANSSVTADEETLRLARDGIYEKAQGLFLSARLILDNLASDISFGLGSETPEAKTLLQKLERLPVGLPQVYEQMLEDNAKKSNITQADQAQILQSVIYASRPMRLIELGSSIARTLHLPGGLKAGKEAVRRSCGQLLEILEDETVSVIHHSFTEFLRNGPRSQHAGAFPILKAEIAHTNLTRVCLQYLDGCSAILKHFSHGIPEKPVGAIMVELQMQYPLLEYAKTNWHLHARESCQGESPDMLTILDAYLDVNRPAFLLWAGLYLEQNQEFSGYHPGTWTKEPIPMTESILPIHMASVLGLDVYVDHLVTRDMTCLEKKIHQDRTPLGIAVIQNHVTVVQVLLAHGADPDPADGQGLKPLHYAIRGQQMEIAQVLLDAGVSPLTERTKSSYSEPGSQGDKGDTPLKYACRGRLGQTGDPGIVRLLVSGAGDDIDLSPYLHWAHGIEVMDILLRTGRVVVDSFVGGSTALYRAALKHDLAAIQKLLEYGADPNKRVKLRISDIVKAGNDSFAHSLEPSETSDGPTPMHAFARYRETFGFDAESKANAASCLGALLSAGGHLEIRADFEQSSKTMSNLHKRTPLHCAVDVHHVYGYRHATADVEVDLSSLLLDAGADVHAATANGDMAIHLLKPGQSPELLACLLARGAQVNARCHEKGVGLTPLLHLMTRAKGMAVSKRDRFLKTVQMLLDRGADVRATSPLRGNTALHYTLEDAFANPETLASKMPLVRSLLQGGADPNQVNHDGLPPLALIGGNRGFLRKDQNSTRDLFQILVEAGMDLGARNAKGESCLWIMASSSLGRGGIRIGRNGDDDDTEVRDNLQLVASFGVDFGVILRGDDKILRSAVEKRAGISTVDLLVKHGANPLLRDPLSGETLIHSVINKWRVGKRFLGEKEQAIKMISRLIELGVSPRQTLVGGRTSLHLASFKDGDWIDILLDRDDIFGALDINCKDDLGATALHYAAASTTSEGQVAALLRRGADPTILTCRGVSALHIATQHRRSNTVVMLLDAYEKRGPQILANIVNMGETGPDGQSALHLACLSGRAESVLYLLDKGADANRRDAHGRTPLHGLARALDESLAWDSERAKELRVEIDQPSTIDIYSEYRPSPLCGKNDMCCGHNKRFFDLTGSYAVEIIHLLAKAGGRLDIAADDGSKPLDAAISHGHHAMVRELLRRGVTSALDAFIDTEEKGTKEEREQEELTPTDDALRLMYAPWDSSVAHELTQLAVDGKYKTIDELVRLGGGDLLAAPSPHTATRRKSPSFIHKMASYGLSWVLEMPSVRAHIAAADSHRSDTRGARRSVVESACESRTCSNLGTIRVLADMPGVCLGAEDLINHGERHMDKATPVSRLINQGNYWSIGAVDFLLSREEGEIGRLVAQKALREAVESVNDWRYEMATMIVQKHMMEPGMMTKALWDAKKDGDITEFLIRSGARVERAPGLLHDAINRMHVDMVKVLLKAGASILVRDPSTNGRYNYCWWDFDYEPDTKKVSDDEDESGEEDDYWDSWRSPENDDTFHIKAPYRNGPQRYALHHALRPQPVLAPDYRDKTWDKRQLDMVKMLMQQGMDPLDRYAGGDTVLHASIEDHGVHLDTIILPQLRHRLLVNNLVGQNGKTLLHSACIPTRPPQHGDDTWWDDEGRKRINQPPPATCKPGLIQALLHLGADPLSTDDIFQRTPLHWLCTQREATISDQNGHLDAVRALLSRAPTTLTTKDRDGFVPIDLAFRTYQLDLCNLLLEEFYPTDTDPSVLFASPSIPNPLHHLAPALVGARESTAAASRLFRTILVASTKNKTASAHPHPHPLVTPDSGGRYPLTIYLATERNPYLLRFHPRHDDPPSETDMDDHPTFIGWHLPNLDLFACSRPATMGKSFEYEDGKGNGPLHITAGRKVRVDERGDPVKDNVRDIVETFSRLMGEPWRCDPRRENGELQTSIDVAVAGGRGEIVGLFREEGG